MRYVLDLVFINIASSYFPTLWVQIMSSPHATSSSSRANNFNLIRMIAAVAVLVSHAYPLAQGPQAVEPLQRMLGMSLGGLAVYSFFVISGYFISQSVDRTPHVAEFAIARALRIYPGLFVVLTMSAFIIGPMFTNLGLREYFLQSNTFLYIPRNLSLAKLQYELPGVFDSNPNARVVNGSLWSLVYEVGCYCMVGCVSLCGFTTNARRFTVFVLMYCSVYAGISVLGPDYHGSRIEIAHHLTWPFVIGMMGYWYRKYITFNIYLLVAISTIAFVSHGRPGFLETFTLAWGYGLLYLGFFKFNPLLSYNRLGDYSYGMYIYAYPVEQIVAALYKGSTPLILAALAFVPTLGLAVLSWHLIEKRANAQRATTLDLLQRKKLTFHRPYNRCADRSRATAEPRYRRGP
jgi:peptidoglycan/LPS O-acetylase OafA/YrhL